MGRLWARVPAGISTVYPSSKEKDRKVLAAKGELEVVFDEDEQTIRLGTPKARLEIRRDGTVRIKAKKIEIEADGRVVIDGSRIDLAP